MPPEATQPTSRLPDRPAWAEIDLGAVVANYRAVRRHVGVPAMAIVKEDAYGHGAVPVARALAAEGPEVFGVALSREAVELRLGGIDAPILVLGCLLPEEIDCVLEHDLTAQISDLAFAEELSRRAVAAGRRLRVHLKVDTGMGRVGVWEEEASEAAARLAAMPGLRLEGLMTHFPSSDDPESAEFTRGQIERFQALTVWLAREGIRVRYRHAANSGACLAFPESWLDLTRPGMILYGCYPNTRCARTIPLRQAMTLKARVVLVKDVPKGRTFSYGRTFAAPRDMRVGVVPVGYGDGYFRRFSNSGRVLIHGKEARIVGRVCMDQFLVDLANAPETRVGDVAVLYGSQGDRSLGITELAEEIGTIPNVLVTALSKRVPRVYVGETGAR